MLFKKIADVKNVLYIELDSFKTISRVHMGFSNK